jgi:L-glutamine---4-(methylsulfanyl)-2-oxobutanoate aminotransferase
VRVRERPTRLDRLPEQYFAALLARVQAAGGDIVDLGRGNPEVGPPPHVVEALCEAARRDDAHGYPPFRGLPELREAVADRYRDVYGVELDPEREVAVVPGTKTAIVELAQVLCECGGRILLPDPGYPDYYSGAALAAAEAVPYPFDDLAALSGDVLYMNFPSNPCAVCAPEGFLAEAVRWAERERAWIVHDFAYGDLVFDGRRPESFLATPGAKEVGVEMFSMSKTYGMAGWRLGFVVGNAEVVARVNLLQDHVRAGVFRPVQEAGIAALSGPQDSVAERVARYEARRDRVLEVVGPARSEGTFYVWFDLPEGLTATRLLAEHGVAVAPGEGFGERGAGWARISVATSDENIDGGLARLRAALA